MCTGAFVSAAAGLLDGKQATTHWLFADKFAATFPAVQLKPEKSVTDDQRILCSGGATTGADLLLYIVRKFCSPQLALECSKKMLMDSADRQQTPYASEQFRQQHNDSDVYKVQLWLEEHLPSPFNWKSWPQGLALGSVILSVVSSKRPACHRFNICRIYGWKKPGSCWKQPVYRLKKSLGKWATKTLIRFGGAFVNGSGYPPTNTDKNLCCPNGLAAIDAIALGQVHLYLVYIEVLIKTDTR